MGFLLQPWHLLFLVFAGYHEERNHQGLANQRIEPAEEVGREEGVIDCRERLGGLLCYSHRKAASQSQFVLPERLPQRSPHALITYSRPTSVDFSSTNHSRRPR